MAPPQDAGTGEAREEPGAEDGRASLTRRLARRLAGAEVSAEDRARAALHVLDWAGCAAAGAASPA
ncbi:MAG: hypothetical protein AAF763_09100, partial [Pseudomonadota bacterium]